MSPLVRSVVVWLGAFLALEIPARFGLVPWFTLSSTCWAAIKWWHPVAYFVGVALVVLYAHLEFRMSVAWLIGVACALTVAVVVHLAIR